MDYVIGFFVFDLLLFAGFFFSSVALVDITRNNSVSGFFGRLAVTILAVDIITVALIPFQPLRFPLNIVVAIVWVILFLGICGYFYVRTMRTSWVARKR